MVLALLLSTALAADPLNALILLSGGPGDSKAADKPLKSFLSMWAKEAALPEGSLDGRYFPKKDEAMVYAKEDSPEVVMLPVETFLELETSWGLDAIGQVALKGSPSEVMYIVVKKGTVANVAALKGKSITSSLLADPKLGDLIELEDGTRVNKIGTLEYERSPLAALRKVREGQAGAVLLDESQWAGLEKLPFSTELELLAKSKPMPRPIVAVQKKVDKSTADKLRKGLITLGMNADAKTTLQQFSVDGIVPPDQALLATVRKRVTKK